MIIIYNISTLSKLFKFIIKQVLTHLLLYFSRVSCPSVCCSNISFNFENQLWSST